MSIQENVSETESGSPTSSQLAALELSTCATTRTLRTIETMAISNKCFDPRHFHSFQSVSFILLPIYKCSGCGERLQAAVPGSSFRPVQCVACKAYAHRSCAFSTTLIWTEKCPKNCKAHTHHSMVEDTSFPHIKEQDVSIKEQPDESLQREAEDKSSAPLQSSTIFRQSPSGELPMDCQEHFLLHRAASEDGVLEKRRRGRTSFPFLSSSLLFGATESKSNMTHEDGSVFRVLKHSCTWNGPNSIQTYDGSLSHLALEQSKVQPDNSATSLIPFSATATTTTISRTAQVSQDLTPPLAGETQASLDIGNVMLEWTHHGPPPHWADRQAFKGIGASSEQFPNERTTENDNENNTVDSSGTALHFARHGFQAVSQALQENIIATFHPIVDRLTQRDGDSDHSSRSNFVDASDFVPAVTCDKTHADSNKIDDDGLQIENHDPCTESSSKLQCDCSMQGLLEESEPNPDPLTSRKRLGMAAVAGSLVGGVAGLAMAGPVGGIIGIKCGQTAGILGLLLEGSLTVGVLVSGVAAGSYTGQHLQEKLEETRVLALGEGTQRRVLLLVRPSVKDPDPAWAELCQEARRTHSCKTGGLVHRFISNEAQSAKRERYEREMDIIQTEEDEIGTADKVLLLVSRTLNNKESLPGHVYRFLLEGFRRRACELFPLQPHEAKRESSDRASSNSQEPASNLGTDDTGKVVAGNERQYSHGRRDDAHAVIKYVTATLLEVRPGFASSPFLTELTATAVEGLVFGEIYDSVMEEIEAEYESQDNELMEKIANFERTHSHAGINNEGSQLKQRSSKGIISEEALGALHSLPQAHSAVDKLRYCVLFLEKISDFFSKTQKTGTLGADSLLKMVCQHILAAKVFAINAQVAFLEEFARDEQLLKGREGYALVTLQASLHFLNSSSDFESDIFDQDDLDS